MTQRTENINKAFASQDTGKCGAALNEIATISDLTFTEKIEISSGLGTLFYRDETGDEELTKVIWKAEEVLASLGPDVTEWIIEQFDEADVESAEHFARALGLIGAGAIDHTIAAFDKHGKDSYLLINLLAALGHFTDPQIAKTLPKAFDLTGSDNLQVKSAALYCIGRVANRIPADMINEEDKTNMFEKCFLCLSDPKALVRRHATRALGKLKLNAYLSDQQADKVFKAFRAILGLDDFEWDIAYIVRAEAEYYLNYCKHTSTGGK